VTTPPPATTLWILRHGQSAGNVARDQAVASGEPLIDIAQRDMDVPLSPLGERQADAIGRWFGALPPSEAPTVVLCSPYARALQTARRLADAAGWEASPGRLLIDERLREKEFGILDRLTLPGIERLHPALAAQRAHVGKFYFRPPGGESWCDVILRLRGVLDTLALDHAGERVLVVAHQVVVNCFRYLLEQRDEASILAIDAQSDVPNCGVTRYEIPTQRGRRAALEPQLVNFVAPMAAQGTPVTTSPDAPAAPKS